MKKNKKQIAKISLLIVSIFAVVIGISYAFINLTLQGTKKQVISAGTLDLILDEDGNNLAITDALPMYDEVGMIQDPFTFRLINKGTTSVNYQLILKKIDVENELALDDVKYHLTKDGTKFLPHSLSLLTSVNTTAPGDNIQAQSLKVCKFQYPNETINTLDDCLTVVNNNGQSYESVYEMMVMFTGSTIIALPEDLGWAACKTAGAETEEECVSMMDGMASSYEALGNIIYSESFQISVDTTTQESSAHSFCEVRLNATTEEACIATLNSQFSQNITTFDEAIDAMFQVGAIPDKTEYIVADVIDSGTIAGRQTIEYEYRMWIDSDVTDNSQIAGKSLSFKLDVEINQEIEEVSCPVLAETTPNKPELASGMIPVTYNEEEKTWVKADSTKTDWYDYENQMWANAVTVTEDTRANYMSLAVGEPISMDDINTMWVWIPRYAYTIKQPYGNSTQKCSNLGELTVSSPSNCRDVDYPDELREDLENLCQEDLNIDVKKCVQVFRGVGGVAYIQTEEDLLDYLINRGELEDTRILLATYPDNIVESASLPGAIDIRFISKSEKPNGTGTCAHCAENWATPEGFTFGTEELPGFWVGKFETTGEITEACKTESCTTSNLTIKPNLNSVVNQTVSSFFYASRSMQNSTNAIKYGFDVIGTGTMDTHMLKNTEWGIVAYLSQSKYGKYGNPNYLGFDKEIKDSSISYDVAGDGYGKSTTGTIYGVYDMSGGKKEYVMGNFQNYSHSSQFCEINGSEVIENCAEWPDAKYYDLYTLWTPAEDYKKGDATYETQNWYDSMVYNSIDNMSWLYRESFGSIFDSKDWVGMEMGFTFRLALKP